MKNGILGNRPLNRQFLQSSKLNENISLKLYPNGNLTILWYFLQWPITKAEVGLFWEKVSKNRIKRLIKQLMNALENLIVQCPSLSVESSAKIA